MAFRAHAGGRLMGKDLKTLLRSFLLFFCLIVYWEILLYAAGHGTLRGMKGWFLLFALSQAMIPAALCGWGRIRLRRAVTALLALILFCFYCAHLIHLRVFGSVISLSMAGMGGDAVESFGAAMMSTVRASLGWLLLCAAPLPMLLLRIFLPGADGETPRLILRLVWIALGIVLWPAAGQALRLGGTGDTSAYRAYTSAYVDSDTSAGRLGVLTNSALEAKSLLSGGDASEMLGLLEEPVPPEALTAPLPAPPAEATPETAGTGRESAPLRHENPAIDFTALAGCADREELAGLCRYFASVPGTEYNHRTGLLAGYNLIYICAEAFSSMAISPEVTPTLYRMAGEGIVLTDYYNSFKNTTTNGEYAMLTGLWPDLSGKADFGETTGSFGRSAAHFMPYGPGNIFRELGVDSFAYHNYFGTYYGRSRTHPNLGYVCRFRGDMRFTDLWPASDLQMMEQSADDYIHLDRFNVYYMTFSGHGPYNIANNDLCSRNFSSVPDCVDGRRLTTHARCYLACNLELERSMEYLLARLAEAGKLDSTLIVIAGDHYPYYLDDESAASIAGGLPDRDFERYRSTCIMWCGGLPEPIVCSRPCCNVDILPTVLNLLGIDFDSRMLSGTDVFSDSFHAAMLYNKSFITDRIRYNAVTGEITVTDPDWHPDEEELRSYADGVAGLLGARYAAALSVNKTDFYRFVWASSGLMPKDG